MKEQNDGGPAFPHMEELNDGRIEVTNRGLSLRDWFAGQAVASVLEAERKILEGDEYKDWQSFRQAVALESYRLADAMIAARKADL